VSRVWRESVRPRINPASPARPSRPSQPKLWSRSRSCDSDPVRGCAGSIGVCASMSAARPVDNTPSRISLLRAFIISSTDTAAIPEPSTTCYLLNSCLRTHDGPISRRPRWRLPSPRPELRDRRGTWNCSVVRAVGPSLMHQLQQCGSLILRNQPKNEQRGAFSANFHHDATKMVHPVRLSRRN
jgi:hypothetical protein